MPVGEEKERKIRQKYVFTFVSTNIFHILVKLHEDVNLYVFAQKLLGRYTVYYKMTIYKNISQNVQRQRWETSSAGSVRCVYFITERSQPSILYSTKFVSSGQPFRNYTIDIYLTRYTILSRYTSFMLLHCYIYVILMHTILKCRNIQRHTCLTFYCTKHIHNILLQIL